MVNKKRPFYTARYLSTSITTSYYTSRIERQLFEDMRRGDLLHGNSPQSPKSKLQNDPISRTVHVEEPRVSGRRHSVGPDKIPEQSGINSSKLLHWEFPAGPEQQFRAMCEAWSWGHSSRKITVGLLYELGRKSREELEDEVEPETEPETESVGLEAMVGPVKGMKLTLCVFGVRVAGNHDIEFGIREDPNQNLTPTSNQPINCNPKPFLQNVFVQVPRRTQEF
ncbi:hypothetical protein DFH08DRAFT_1054498 [Mycena albidolilacea]|uniref:Uncharacterized protein n=1 Tax=Mycena albidolilacea TaxID=1033008 RepID=A0AAD7E9X5_9AGAR|nr:hypothetical protein DFH08DRAFT_1054498 [Mycena albidolilacea]